jgi:5,10-methenyltetrahydrofolate synthetase
MRLDQQKRDLRSSFRQRAELFQPHLAAFIVERLNENLIRFLKQQSGTWAAFRGHQHEPRLEAILKASSHIDWIFPRVDGQDMAFVSSKEFKTGKYGIEEPMGGKVVDIKDIQGLLVPGLAFDKTGTRLGRGKGYYDRVLKNAEGFLVGVCFGFQIHEGSELPYESNDVKMDFLMSEQGLMTCAEKG